MAIWTKDDGALTPQQLANVSGQPKLKREAKRVPVPPRPRLPLLPYEPEPKPRIKKSAKKVQVRQICKYRTKTGAPCTARQMENVSYCTDHRPPHKHLTAEELGLFNNMLDEIGVNGIIALVGWGRVREWVRNYEREVTRASEESTRQ